MTPDSLMRWSRAVMAAVFCADLSLACAALAVAVARAAVRYLWPRKIVIKRTGTALCELECIADAAEKGCVQVTSTFLRDLVRRIRVEQSSNGGFVHPPSGAYQPIDEETERLRKMAGL